MGKWPCLAWRCWCYWACRSRVTTRYVLRDNGTFALHLPDYELPGRYTEAGGIVTFDFDWNQTTAGARGVFSRDAMTVTYIPYMSLSDFEDAVYIKRP